MAKLIYSAITSLDGFVADEDGDFRWAMPSEEVHQFVNDLERPVGTYLYGRRMYEVMRVWDEPETVAGEPQVMHDYADIWRAADKVVYSKTLDGAMTARTRVERDFDPSTVERMKDEAPRDISIGGPGLASHALRAGLVDEIHLLLNPIVIGRGNPVLPDDVRAELQLLDEHRFANGVVYLRYASLRPST